MRDARVGVATQADAHILPRRMPLEGALVNLLAPWARPRWKCIPYGQRRRLLGMPRVEVRVLWSMAPSAGQQRAGRCLNWVPARPMSAQGTVNVTNGASRARAPRPGLGWIDHRAAGSRPSCPEQGKIDQRAARAAPPSPGAGGERLHLAARTGRAASRLPALVRVWAKTALAAHPAATDALH